MSKKAIFYLGAAFAVIGVSAWAAVSNSVETVTVTPEAPPALTADLDPMQSHHDSFTGQQIDRDIEQADRHDAFQALARSLVGPLNNFYEWHGFYDQGQFIPTRQFTDAGLLCRDFSEHTQHHLSEGYDPQHPEREFDDRPSVVFGTACREQDGWHFR